MEIIKRLRAKIGQQPYGNTFGSMRRTLRSDDIGAICEGRLRHHYNLPRSPFLHCPICASHLRDSLGDLPYCPVCGHPPEMEDASREFRCPKADILHPLNCIGQCIYVVFAQAWWGGVITDCPRESDAVCVSFVDGTKHDLHLQQKIWRPCGSVSIHMPVQRFDDLNEPTGRVHMQPHLAQLALAKSEWADRLSAKCQEAILDILGWRLIAVIVAYLACPE